MLLDLDLGLRRLWGACLSALRGQHIRFLSKARLFCHITFIIVVLGVLRILAATTFTLPTSPAPPLFLAFCRIFFERCLRLFSLLVEAAGTWVLMRGAHRWLHCFLHIGSCTL